MKHDRSIHVRFPEPRQMIIYICTVFAHVELCRQVLADWKWSGRDVCKLATINCIEERACAGKFLEHTHSRKLRELLITEHSRNSKRNITRSYWWAQTVEVCVWATSFQCWDRVLRCMFMKFMREMYSSMRETRGKSCGVGDRPLGQSSEVDETRDESVTV